MASRKHGLSNEEIQCMLSDGNDSYDDISELDNLSSSSSVENSSLLQLVSYKHRSCIHYSYMY